MIETRGISRTWGTFSLSDVSLSVDRGEYLVILGPCGAGKTLLLETIAGLHAPSSGSVLISGNDVTRLAPEKRRVGFVYQQQLLFPHLTVKQNIAYGLRYLRLDSRAQEKRVTEMIDLLDLHNIEDRRDPTSLSGGETQQVAIARALAIEPAALLLDEPLGSLDFTTRGNVLETLRDVARRTQVPVIHVTHDQVEAATLASRVAVINEGKIIQTGSVDDVFWRPQSRFVAGFVGVDNLVDGVAAVAGQGMARISVGSATFDAQYDGPAGSVTLCVRPEDVIVSRNGDQHPNSQPAVLSQAAEDGFSVRMTLGLDDGPHLIARMARTAFRGIAPAVGDRLYVGFPPAAAHVIPSMREDDHGTL